MKNSKNDNLTIIDDTETVFGDLPTAEEADRMLAEAAIASASAETDATDRNEFDETAVTELALRMIRTADTAAVAGSQTENAGQTVDPPRSTFRPRRRALRVALIAACVAALLFGTFVAAANVIYDVRFTQLIGVEGTMTELKSGYFQIGLSKTIDDLTVTVVDAIGDVRVQWVEIRTNRRLVDGTPDGWLEDNFTDDGLYAGTPAMPDGFAATDFRVSYYDGSLFSTVFSDIDCTERYQKHLVNKPSLDMGGSLIPFCRDGYLWYMMQVSCKEDINRSFTHLEIGFDTSAQKDVMFEFNWCNNYKSDKETFRVNRSVGRSKVKKVVLGGASMFVYVDGGSDDICLNSVTLRDGTVLYTNQGENETAPDKTGVSHFPNDGRQAGGSKRDGIFTSSYAEYSLLPGVTFRTPQSFTSLIPMDEIVSITINGTEISLR